MLKKRFYIFILLGLMFLLEFSIKFSNSESKTLKEDDGKFSYENTSTKFELKNRVFIYAEFDNKGNSNLKQIPHGVKKRYHQKINEELHLQIYTNHYAKIKGITGYTISFAKDESGQKYIEFIGEPRHGPKPIYVDAHDFLYFDKELKGSKEILNKLNDYYTRYRIIEYQNFNLHIHILKYRISKLEKDKVPTFESLVIILDINMK